jgi:hypothetical protein
MKRKLNVISKSPTHKAFEYIELYAKLHNIPSLPGYKYELVENLTHINQKFSEIRFAKGQYIVTMKGPSSDGDIGEILNVISLESYKPSTDDIKDKEITLYCVYELTPSDWEEDGHIASFKTKREAQHALSQLRNLQTFNYENTGLGYGEEWIGRIYKQTYQIDEDGEFDEFEPLSKKMVTELFVPVNDLIPYDDIESSSSE